MPWMLFQLCTVMQHNIFTFKQFLRGTHCCATVHSKNHICNSALAWELKRWRYIRNVWNFSSLGKISKFKAEPVQNEDCSQLAYVIKFVAFQIVLMHGLFTGNAKWMVDWSLLYFSMTAYVSRRLCCLCEKTYIQIKTFLHRNPSTMLNTNVWLGSGEISRCIWTTA